ncbi:MAG: hypothetical protein CMM60_12975 [Rhodospirillaceae bacterium]|jgi:methionyl-tRNA formyltransferase|nr:hypothetical protein [Rhodospirillaceae bacterium]|tara:strand:- start:397 stop:1068 length:672 start_codon:yes stop_codon:yes gene_type:complete
MGNLLFLGKRDDAFCDKAARHVHDNFSNPEIHLARRGDPWPAEIDDWRGNSIISYLSPFILPPSLLDNAKGAALNFHPGPPQYPGIGCTNFALYNGETEYGVTCHHMAAKVDTGPIIAVRRFDILPDDSVLSLTERCYAHIYDLFMEITGVLLAGRPLPVADETWTREPYKRHELDSLCRITPDMEAEEIERRIRAVTFPGAPGAFVELQGHRFAYAGGEPQS